MITFFFQFIYGNENCIIGFGRKKYKSLIKKEKLKNTYRMTNVKN